MKGADMTTSEDNKPALLRRTFLAVAIGALGLAAARADAAELVRLDVIDRETGQAARVWRHAGRLYVAGRPGARYSLRVTNNTGGRVLVVMSVDGVNILTGETASYGQRGYIFRAYEGYDISGWRKSDSEVAAFTFASLPNSYAARTGRPGNVGVIGIAAFTERPPPPVVYEEYRRQAEPLNDEAVVTGSRVGRSAPAPAAPPALAMPQGAAKAAPPREMAQRSEKLGTGHGAREYSAVTTVAFERATSQPQFILRLEYDSYANLVAGGVIPRPRPRPVPSRPRPFPASPDGGGYVPDPPF